MSLEEETLGYHKSFLGEGNLEIPLMPMIDQSKYQLAELIDQPGKYVLDYQNYSVIMDKERKFPILTAANIDGILFKKVDRAGSWKKDTRIEKSAQWGAALYQAEKSEFDKGHMTKREDVQWGMDAEVAMAAAKSTFYYTNAIPQHARLNRSVWRSIESYILKSEAVKHQLKVVVLTGPVLHDYDPEFVTIVKDETVRIPVLFWKIVYYVQQDGQLSRTAFLVSQKELLERERIVKRSPTTRSTRDKRDEQYFLRFKRAETYQVKVDLVESLTGLNFPDATEAFQDDRPTMLILKQINVRGEGTEEEVKIKNLVL